MRVSAPTEYVPLLMSVGQFIQHEHNDKIIVVYDIDEVLDDERDDILYLHAEDIRDHPHETVAIIGEYLGHPLTEEEICSIV